jgi:hypothetical protein
MKMTKINRNGSRVEVNNEYPLVYQKEGHLVSRWAVKVYGIDDKLLGTIYYDLEPYEGQFIYALSSFDNSSYCTKTQEYVMISNENNEIQNVSSLNS